MSDIWASKGRRELGINNREGMGAWKWDVHQQLRKRGNVKVLKKMESSLLAKSNLENNAGAPAWYQEAWPRWRHTRGHSWTHTDWTGRYLTVTEEIWCHDSSSCWDSLNRFEVLDTWHTPPHWATVYFWVLELWILTQSIWLGLDVAMIWLWGCLRAHSFTICLGLGLCYTRKCLWEATTLQMLR